MGDNNNNVNGKDFLIGAFVGGIIGACAALLLAPKSGRELRVDLTDGYHTATKKTQELAKNVSEKSEIFIEKAKDVAGQVKDVAVQVKGVAGNVKEDFQKWRETSAEASDDLFDDDDDFMSRREKA